MDDIEISAMFGTQSLFVDCLKQSKPQVLIPSPLLFQGGRTEIIEHRIQLEIAVTVIADLSRRYRRIRQRCVDELFSEFREVLLRTLRRAGGYDQGEKNQSGGESHASGHFAHNDKRP